ncbi:MAG: hypothetical protein WA003_16420 [Desulfuromonadaceae bacterium]
MNTIHERVHSIFKTAGAYSLAAKLLNAQGASPVLLPSMVNASLALELYFKSIYLLEYKKDFKVKDRHSHDFHALFNELTTELKQEIEAPFNESLKNRDMRDTQQIKKIVGITAKLDLLSNLKNWSSVFVKVRYAFDKKEIPETMMFFPEIESALINTIKKRKPEWFA